MKRRMGSGIRSRLILGFGFVLVLLALAGTVGWRSMTLLKGAIRQSMQGVEQDARLSAMLATDVAREIAVAARYIEQGEVAAAEFDSLRWQTHRTQRQLRRDGQTQQEVELVVGIDQQLSDAEVRYVAARRLAELGRGGEAAAQTDTARAMEAQMLGALSRLADVKGARVAAAEQALEADASAWRLILAALLLSALVIGLLAVWAVLRSITGPLDVLAAHAGRLSEGDLTARTEDRLPDELHILATAMNRTSDSLSRIGAGAAQAADGITASTTTSRPSAPSWPPPWARSPAPSSRCPRAPRSRWSSCGGWTGPCGACWTRRRGWWPRCARWRRWPAASRPRRSIAAPRRSRPSARSQDQDDGAGRRRRRWPSTPPWPT